MIADFQVQFEQGGLNHQSSICNLKSEILQLTTTLPTLYSWHSATESARIRASELFVLIPIQREIQREIERRTKYGNEHSTPS